MKQNNEMKCEEMETFKPPPCLNFTNANIEDWKLWLQKLNLYLEVSGNADVSDSRKIAILLYSIGDMGIRLFNTFGTLGQELTYSEVVRKFSDYFQPRKGLLSHRKNIVYERYKFLSYCQKTQSNTRYLGELKNLVSNCDYLEEENMVRDAFILGMTDRQLKRQLLEMKNLTLSNLERLLRAYEIDEVNVDKTFKSLSHQDYFQGAPYNRLGVKPKRKEGAQIEEVEVSDDPPNYEPPPDYAEIMKMEEETKRRKSMKLKSSRGGSAIKESDQPVPIPDSPPPPYSDTQQSGMTNDSAPIGSDWTTFDSSLTVAGCSTSTVFGSSVNRHQIDHTHNAYLTQENNSSGSSSGTSSVNENRCPYDFSKLWNLFPGKNYSHNNTRELLEQSTCSCEGACGCASASNARRVRSESVNLPSMAATWSPATTKFKELDVSNNCEERKMQNLFFSSIKNHKGTIKGSTSADNLHYLN